MQYEFQWSRRFHSVFDIKVENGGKISFFVANFKTQVRSAYLISGSLKSERKCFLSRVLTYMPGNRAKIGRQYLPSHGQATEHHRGPYMNDAPFSFDSAFGKCR